MRIYIYIKVRVCVYIYVYTYIFSYDFRHIHTKRAYSSTYNHHNVSKHTTYIHMYRRLFYGSIGTSAAASTRRSSGLPYVTMRSRRATRRAPTSLWTRRCHCDGCARYRRPRRPRFCRPWPRECPSSLLSRMAGGKGRWCTWPRLGCTHRYSSPPERPRTPSRTSLWEQFRMVSMRRVASGLCLGKWSSRPMGRHVAGRALEAPNTAPTRRSCAGRRA